VLNRNFHSNVNVLGRFYKQFLTLLHRSTLFGIFLKPDWKKKYLQVEQRQHYRIKVIVFILKSCCSYQIYIFLNNKRLLHDIFHIGPGISPRLPYQARYQARQRSWRADMGRVNVLGRFYKQFLTLLHRSTLFGIFLKPDWKKKYLQVEQRQLY
jgi:hypothetical protein